MIFNVQMTGGVNTKDATATAKDILNGKSAYVNNEKVVGEMADNGDVNSAIQNGILKEGYTSGGQIENLTAENVRENVVIGGIEGKFKDKSEEIHKVIFHGYGKTATSVWSQDGKKLGSSDGGSDYVVAYVKGQYIFATGYDGYKNFVGVTDITDSEYNIKTYVFKMTQYAVYIGMRYWSPGSKWVGIDELNTP